MSESNFMDAIMDCTDLPGMDGENVKYEPLELVEVTSNPKNRTPDLEDDYEQVRKTYYFQQQMILSAAKQFLESAKNADSPRHMEVFSTLMGQMTSTNEKILKLHREMKEITSETTTVAKGDTPKNVSYNNTNVFLGGPTELMDREGDAFEVSLVGEE